jgi:hypothetical protein
MRLARPRVPDSLRKPWLRFPIDFLPEEAQSRSWMEQDGQIHSRKNHETSVAPTEVSLKVGHAAMTAPVAEEVEHRGSSPATDGLNQYIAQGEVVHSMPAPLPPWDAPPMDRDRKRRKGTKSPDRRT